MWNDYGAGACDTIATMKRPTLVLIAAVPRNRAIGKSNALIWHNAEDQRHFRRVTMGHPVVMGRKTWDSLPAKYRPLPGRRNVVLTRTPFWQAQGAEAVGSIDAALELLAGSVKAYVIGGAEIYALALPLANELVLTEIDADLCGDAFFPEWHPASFVCTSREPRDGFSVVTYTRNGGTSNV